MGFPLDPQKVKDFLQGSRCSNQVWDLGCEPSCRFRLHFKIRCLGFVAWGIEPLAFAECTWGRRLAVFTLRVSLLAALRQGL